MRFLANKKIIILSSIVVLLVILLTSLAVFLMFLLPKYSAEIVPLYERVYNEDKPIPINAPVYDNLEQAKKADIYVDAISGDDQNTGDSEAEAVCSLFVAQERARQLIAGGKETVKVLIKAGEYLLDKEWSFDERDSNVTYENYPYEYPVISTSRAITDWKNYADGIFVADIPQGYEPDLVGENGVIGTIARYPNSGYLFVNSQPDKIVKGVEPQTNSFGYAKDSIIDSLSGEANLQVKMFAGGPHGEYNWFSHIYPVTGIKTSKRLINLDRSMYTDNKYYLGVGSRYFLQNSLKLLDTKGEYYIDNANHKLYYYPQDANNLTNGKIQINTSKNVINVSGQNGGVQNLHFKGLALEGAGIGEFASDNNGIVRVENTNNVSIENCKLYQGGKYGVIGIGKNYSLNVQNNWIYDLGHSGVQIIGDTKDAYNQMCSDILVSNNYIHDMGLIYGHGVGVQFVAVKNSKITNNTITRTPRYSISLKGVGTEEIYAALDGNPDKAYDFEYGNNLIAYNDCSMANLDTQDTGVIEMYSAGAGNKVIGNYIHDSYIYFSFGAGLYVDDYNVDTYIENNIFYNLGAKAAPSQKGHKYGELMAVIFAKFHGNKILNNYIIDCNATTAILLADYDRGATVEKVSDCVVERNLIANTYNSQTLLANGFFRKFTQNMLDIRKAKMTEKQLFDAIDSIVKSDNNVMFNDTLPSFKLGREYMIALNGVSKFSVNKWINKSKQDANSIVDTSVQIDKKTFVIDTQNPAIMQCGITQIDFSKIGVKNNWYY